MRDQNRQRIAAAALAALTAVGAYIQLPLPLVPVTLQTLFVYLSGLLLTPAYASLAQAIYLAAGLAGAPVFAGGSGGIAALYSPTFGYLLSFPLAAWLVGHVGARAGWAQVAGLAAAGFVMLVVGCAYMWGSLRWVLGRPIGVWQAVWAGALVFVPGEALKMAVAWALARRLRSATRWVRSSG